MNNKTKLKNIENLKDCFTSSGQLASELIYTESTGKFYNKALYVFDTSEGKFDLTSEDVKKLKERFPDAEVTFQKVWNNSKTSSVDEDDDDDEIDIYKGGNWQGSWIRISQEGLCLYIDCDSITILYDDANFDCDTFSKDIGSILSRKPREIKSSEVQLVVFNQEYYTVNSKINPTTVDINKNYNDDFKQPYADLVKFLKSRECGVAILRGAVGSGNFI